LNIRASVQNGRARFAILSIDIGKRAHLVCTEALIFKCTRDSRTYIVMISGKPALAFRIWGAGNVKAV